MRTFLAVQWLRIHLSMKGTQVQSLVREDPLEKDMATHSSILAWKIPWTEEPGRLQFVGLERVGRDWSDLVHIHSRSLKRRSLIHRYKN